MKYLSVQSIAATSITPTFNGPTIDASQLLAISVQAVLTGTSPNGSIKIQASNDVCNAGNLPSGSFTPTNWTDISGATVAYTTTGTVLIPKLELCYRWIRIVNTFVSGTGTAAVNVFGIST